MRPLYVTRLFSYACTLALALFCATSSSNAQVGPYCASSALENTGVDIVYATITCLGNNSQCNELASGISSASGLYSNYYPIGTLYAVSLGELVWLEIGIENCSGTITDSVTIAVYVDWNQDNVFDDTDELVAYGVTGDYLIVSAEVPLNAQPGYTGIRFIAVKGVQTAIPPCGTYDEGETEDYIIYLMDPQLPVFTIEPYIDTVSCGADVAFVVADQPQWGTGTFQWQTSTDSVTWSNTSVWDVPGFTLNAVATKTYVRLKGFGYNSCTILYSPVSVVHVTAVAGSCSGQPVQPTIFSNPIGGTPTCSTFFYVDSTIVYPCGVIYQWQYFNGANWVDILYANNHTYQAFSPAASYRLKVTCSFAGLTAESNVIAVTPLPSLSCYCPATTQSNGNGYHIEHIQLNTFDTITGPNAPPPTYFIDYGSQPMTALEQGSAYQLGVTVGDCDSCYVRAWIDYNQDGDFNDAGESLSLTTQLSYGGVVYIPFTVPPSAVAGNTTIRVRVANSTMINPCLDYSLGETEQFKVQITSLIDCVGTPSGGTAATTNPAPAVGEQFVISVSGSSYGMLGGLSVQWEVSTTGATGPWTNIPNAVYPSLTHSHGGLYTRWYRRRINCFTTDSAYSNAIEITSVVPPCFTITGNVTNATCSNANGSIALNISGGAPPYSYVWSNAYTTANNSSLAAGQYNVTVTDSTGCTATQIFSVSNSTVALSLTSAPVSFLNFDVAAVASGGTPPYSFTWNNGVISQNQTVSPGTYCVTVTDADGCSVASCITVTGSVNYAIVSVQITGAPGAVTIGFAENGGASTIAQTDASGAFTDTVFTVASQGWLYLFFQNCNGDTYVDSAWYANGSTVAFTADFCSNVVSPILYGQLLNTGGIGVPVIIVTSPVSGGVTVTNSSGAFTAALSPGDTASISYNMCDGTFVEEFIYATPGATSFNYTGTYCNVVPVSAMVSGNIAGAPGNTTVTIVTDLHPGYTVYTNPFGGYAANVPVSNVANPVVVSFTDCSGTLQDTVLLLSPGTNSAVYNDDYCPGLVYYVTVTGQVTHLVGAPVFVQLSTDSETTTVSTDANGNFSTVLEWYLVPQVTLQFTDCSNHPYAFTETIVNDTAWFTVAYCPCGVMFTTSYDATNNAFILELDSAATANAIWWHWTFGDGNSSSDVYPTHVYDSTALYEVCVFTMDISGSVCHYCHVIGFDSLGNLVLRNDGSGFSLIVVPYGTTDGWFELPDETFDLYPNPVNDNPVIRLFADEERAFTISVFNSLGQRTHWMTLDALKGYNYVNMPLHTLVPGLYIMSIDFGSKTVSRTFVR